MSGYEIFLANPIRKRRKAKSGVKSMSRKTRRIKRRAKSRRFASNPIFAPRRRKTRRHRASFRRNPIRSRARRAVAFATQGKGKLNIGALVMPSLMAGAGAVVADILMGYAPLPAALKTGPVRHLSKAGLSVGLGYLISKLANRKLGETVAVGGLAITVHDALREQVAKFAPAIKFGEYLDGYGYVNSGEPVGQMGQYLGDSRSLDQVAFQSNLNAGSYMSPAMAGAEWDEF